MSKGTTDCFICGHPILEGQPSGRYMPESGHVLGSWATGPRAHLNSADHLPTLGEDYALVFVERERAARLAEELSVRLQQRGKDEEAPVSEEWHRGWDSAVGWISDLAEQIRGNE